MSPTVTVCGLGPGGAGDLTEATAQALAEAKHRFLRTSRHPTADRVQTPTTFDRVYDAGSSLAEVYQTIADTLVEAATQSGEVLYAVPGSPLVLERAVAHLLSDDRVKVNLVPSLSFLDVAWARLGIDPVEAGVRLVDGHVFESVIEGERGPLLVAHAHASWVLSEIKLSIDAGPEQKVVVLKGLGTREEEIFEVPWPELDRSFEPDHLTSLYLPEIVAPTGKELQRSVQLMHRLRQECPWDGQQTHASLRRFLLEESYEVLEALDGLIGVGLTEEDATSAAYAELEEELGDLWFQILFHAELASEVGAFSMSDVARTVHDKLVARHPHVFAETEVATADDVVSNWEAIKKVEKGRQSIMDGIPAALPSLSFAHKVLEKAERSGHTADSGLVAAVMDAGLMVGAGETELGHLLLALVEQARSLDLDPERALGRAARAARDRYRSAEAVGGSQELWVFG